MREARRIGAGLDAQALAAPHLRSRRRGAPIDAHALVAHPGGEAASRVLGQEPREDLVQTQPGAVGRDFQLERVGRGACAIIFTCHGLHRTHET